MLLINRGTIPFHDEGLARSADLGILAHRAIAALAAKDQAPTLPDQTRVINELLLGVRPVEKRAHQQNLRAAVMSYFSRLALPEHWKFCGSETLLDRGRVDLVWRNTDGQILIDEVKTGHHWRLGTTQVELQVHQYVASGLDRWGGAFLGCRLLSTHNPATSTFTGPSLEPVPLSNTPYRK